MELSYIKKTTLSLVILGISLAISIYYGPNLVSVIGGAAGFLIFSYNFKKVLGPIIFLLIFLLPMALSPFSHFSKYPISFFNFHIPYSSKGVDFSHPEEPTLSIPSAQYIEIDGPGFIVEFDKDREDILVPESVRLKRVGDSLTISAYPVSSSAKPSTFLDIFKKGGVRAKKIVIGAGSQIKRLSIDTMGVKIEGYINAKKISLDGMGIKIQGTLDIDTLEADGMGIKIDAKVIRAPSIEINGMGAVLDLDYIKPWEGVWHLSVSGMGSKIQYRLPENNPGKLEIEKEGMGNVVKGYGD